MIAVRRKRRRGRIRSKKITSKVFGFGNGKRAKSGICLQLFRGMIGKGVGVLSAKRGNNQKWGGGRVPFFGGKNDVHTATVWRWACQQVPFWKKKDFRARKRGKRNQLMSCRNSEGGGQRGDRVGVGVRDEGTGWDASV